MKQMCTMVHVTENPMLTCNRLFIAHPPCLALDIYRTYSCDQEMCRRLHRSPRTATGIPHSEGSSY